MGVTASSQVESNRKWFPWHTLVAFEVLGQRVEGLKGRTDIANNCKYKSRVAFHSTAPIPFQVPHYTFIMLQIHRPQ